MAENPVASPSDNNATTIREQTIGDPARLATLRRTALLDTPAEESFDRMTRLASKILHTPVSLVSLIDEDRQFFKSCVGLPEPWASERETPFSHSFCQHTVITRKPLIIDDARDHPLVRDNLAIPDLNVIAYAGIPLITSEGYVLGSFCAIDTKPRHWTDEEIEILTDLAASVTTEIELRLVTRNAKEAVELRDRVLSVVSHDLKNPLTAIKGYASMMGRRLRKSSMEMEIAPKLLEDIEQLDSATNRMWRQIDELVEVTHLQTGQPLELRRENIELVEFVRAIIERHQLADARHSIVLTTIAERIVGAWDGPRLERVFDNLISNAVKYSPAGGAIAVEIEQDEHSDGKAPGSSAIVRVRDQGLGIAAADIPFIFNWYYRATNSRDKITGTGIGLASSYTIVQQHGGVIEVASEEGSGSTFTVILPVLELS